MKVNLLEQLRVIPLFSHMCAGQCKTNTCIGTTHGHVWLSPHIYQRLGLREFCLTCTLDLGDVG